MSEPRKTLDGHPLPPSGTRVKIGPFRYEIRWMKLGDDEDCLGKCNNDDHIISVGIERNAFRVADSLLHEITHGIIAVFTSQNPKYIKDHEIITEAVATGILCVFLDNEWLWPLLKSLMSHDTLDATA